DRDQGQHAVRRRRARPAHAQRRRKLASRPAHRGRHRTTTGGDRSRRHSAGQVRRAGQGNSRAVPRPARPMARAHAALAHSYVAKDRVADTDLTYEGLADPKWRGKICIRSGQHPYNTSLFAAFIAKHGEAKTETWLKGLKANLARKPSGG